MSDSLVYLAVLKASYDYDPQSDDEIPIKENQLLLLLDKVDDDWWKVKIKSSAAEDEGPSGLVPAAYVEPADHVSVVKVLYDYEATSPGELSVQEDEILLVYETDEDWLLVQSRKEGSKAGYVPGNYVETTNEEEESAQAASVDVPSARPVSIYIDPADRVASSKAAQPNIDSIKTWPVTSIDKKGKKKKGTLGVGNGAIFFASESDKTPVQKWQTSDVSDATTEKGKQVRIDIGGDNPITLHYNVGSKDNAEVILEKVQSSKALSNSRASRDLPVDGPSTSSASSMGRKVGKKVSVHFSQADPVIIPSREEEEEEGGEGGEDNYPEDPSEEQRDGEEEGEHGEQAVALYDFSADGDDELSIKEGEKLIILEKDGDEWWKCSNSKGEEGVVPASYLQVQVAPQPVISPPLPSRANAIAERERAVAAAREAEEQAEADRRRREEEQRQLEKVRKKQEAQRAKEAATAEKKKDKAEAVHSSSPATSQTPAKKGNENGSAGRQAAEVKFPPEDQVRTWHDRSGQFRVEAAFLGLNGNKIRLHKVNGVIVEVPTEKMSVDDIRYVERLMKKSSKSNQKISDDDVPLAVSRAQSSQRITTSKKSWDWFEFFLSAGCDVDDCTRYTASFERDKIDEAILSDITESTMRTLGLREGDIIRVTKAIEKRKPESRSSSKQANAQVQAQIRLDEELARQLQEQETGGGSPRSPAPNLFSGPGGVLKAPRKRPQPTKSLPPNVDIKALSSTPDQATNSPQPNTSSSTPVQPPARTSSAAQVASGFDDDAWINRPNSNKPFSSASPVTAPRVPSAPMSAPLVPANGTTVQTVASTPPPRLRNTASPVNPPSSAVQPGTTASSSLVKTTEADIFDQLARLSELRKPGTPSSAPSSSSPAIISPPPASYQAGLGMGPSPLPIGHHLQNQQLQGQQQPGLVPSPSPQAQVQPQPYNGPRGPYAPVPVNQGLLQPLVPTQTNFGGFVPTRPMSHNSNAVGIAPSFQPPAPQPFLPAQATGLPNQVILPQPTGAPFSGFASTTVAPSTFQGTGGFGTLPAPMQSQFTGLNPNVGQFPSNNFLAPPVPPLPTSLASPAKDTSPANVFAQMKSGTFANEDGTQAQSAEKYDVLRPAPLLPQPTGWTAQYQTGFAGYPS